MSRSKNMIKVWAGRAFEIIVPSAVHDLETGTAEGRFVKIKQWILYSRTTRARTKGDTGALQKTLFQFWRTKTADAYFDKYLDRYQKWFLGPHHEIVDQLAALARTGDYARLIEVGCGSGRVLEHCAAAMPNVPECIGVDINPGIIARNRTTFATTPRLQFLAADASAWLLETARPGTILLTYGGVMEYFSPQTLATIFQALAQQGTAAVALVEPVDPDHDLQNDGASHAFGAENSFSHNHETLLQTAGFQTMFRKTLGLGGQSWIMLLAVVETRHSGLS